jgi:hypothetical protein
MSNEFVGPKARVDDLIVTDAGEETLVYDLRIHRAHALDRRATRLWRLCDGRRDTTALARELRALEAVGDSPEVDEQTSEAIVRYSLAQLSAARLLCGEHRSDRVTRRALLRQLAGAGVSVMVVPTIFSVIAPSTLQAQASCLPLNSDCVSNLRNCCAGLSCRPIGGGVKLCI